MVVFISYRRDDSHHVADRLDDRLVRAFGRKRVTKDIYSIRAGANLREAIPDLIEGCDVLLAVIGPRWLTVVEKDGRRRIDNPADYVRGEIESALARKIPLIPVLVDGATPPVEDDLPDSLKSLAYRKAIAVRPDPDFEWDAKQLVEMLRKLEVRKPVKVPWRRLAAVALLALGVTAAAIRRHDILDAASGLVAWFRAEPSAIAEAKPPLKPKVEPPIEKSAAPGKAEGPGSPSTKIGEGPVHRKAEEKPRDGTKVAKRTDLGKNPVPSKLPTKPAPDPDDPLLARTLRALFELKPGAGKGPSVALLATGYVTPREIEELTDALKSAGASVTTFGNFYGYDEVYEKQTSLFQQAIKEAGGRCAEAHFTSIRVAEDIPIVNGIPFNPYPDVKEDIMVLVGGGADKLGFADRTQAGFIRTYFLEKHKDVYVAPSASFAEETEAGSSKPANRSEPRVISRGQERFADLPAFLKEVQARNKTR